MGVDSKSEVMTCEYFFETLAEFEFVVFGL